VDAPSGAEPSPRLFLCFRAIIWGRAIDHGSGWHRVLHGHPVPLPTHIAGPRC